MFFVIVPKNCLNFIKDSLFPEFYKLTLLSELHEVNCYIARICQAVRESYRNRLALRLACKFPFQFNQLILHQVNELALNTAIVELILASWIDFR